MSINSRVIAKNASVLFASQIITWLLSLVLSVFLPRYLGASAIGEISIAFSIWTLASVLISFGMDVHLTKTIAREPDQLASLLTTSIVLRIGFFIVSCFAIAGYLWVFDYKPTTVVVVWIFGAMTLFNALSSALIAVFSGLERMEYMSLANVASKVVYTGLTLLFLFLGADLYLIASVHSIAAFTMVLVLGWALWRIQPVRHRPDWQHMRTMLLVSRPYVLASVAMVAYQQIDKLIMSTMVDTTVIGWYSVAATLTAALMFVPSVFSTVIFPAVSRGYVHAREDTLALVGRSFDLMWLLSIPMGYGVVLIGEPLIVLVLGAEFRPAGTILTLLGIALIFTYMNTVLSQFLISMDRTGRLNGIMIGALFAALPLNLFLVPWTQQTYGNGALGGAMSFIIGELGILAAIILVLPRGVFQWQNVRSAALTLCAASIMLLVCWWWRELIPLTVMLGALVYALAVYLLRVVPRNDLLALQRAITSLFGRFMQRTRARTVVSGD